jgi:plastocyanin
MRRLYLALAALAVVAVIPTAAAAPTATHAVKITRTGFSPARLSIQLGDRVTWTNSDTINHQVVADNGAFASPIIGPGKSYSFTFRACCLYPYHDALHPGLKGTVTVKGPPPSLSVALTPPILRYGDSVTVTAQASSHKAGEAIAILATPVGGSTQTAATLVSDANGVVTYTSQPQIGTTYQAKWKSIASQAVTVQVRPKLTLLPYEGRLYAKALSSRSYAGLTIYLQRLSSFGQWVTVAKYKLGAKSGRIFNRPRTVGTYHVYLPADEAGAGYLDGWSGTQKVVRRR